MAVYPFLIALYPFLYFCSLNIKEIGDFYTEDFILVLLSIVFVSLIVCALSHTLIKDRPLSCLISSIILLLFFAGGDFFFLLHEGLYIGPVKITMKNEAQVFLLLLLLSTLLVAFLFKATKVFRARLHNGISIFGLIIFCFPLINLGYFLLAEQGFPEKNLPSIPNSDVNASFTQSSVTSELPDIYYIILDGYANHKPLKAFFNHDHVPFLKTYEELGFYVAWDSTSNYPYTLLSLPSSLNFSYLDELLPTNTTLSHRDEIRNRLISDPKIAQVLKRAGYHIINISSGWGPTYQMKAADINTQCGELNEFKILVAKKTLLGLLFKQINVGRREQVLCAFQRLPDLASKPSPKFVIAHILSPHHPYLFDRNGNAIEDTSDLGAYDLRLKKYYLEQLLFIGSQTKSAVQEIINRSKKRPIIIIQSDHGSAFQFCTTCLEPPNGKMFAERYPILNLYYVPAELEAELYPSITPVNTFRLVLNHVLKTNYPLLPDRNYYAKSKDLYEYEDVTTQVQGSVSFKSVLDEQRQLQSTER